MKAQNLGLTHRECNVLQLIADGKTDKEIAFALRISTASINKDVRAILLKVGAASRTAAAVRAIRVGLIV